MLTGQEISFVDSLVIAVIGMVIVMFELGLLSFFIFILSKILVPFSRRKEVEKTAAENPDFPGCGLEDDEVAAVLVAVCQESGYSPDQISIKSIQEKQ